MDTLAEGENADNSAVAVSSYTTEFRAFNDDAWYTVRVLMEGEALRVKFSNFSDEHDNVFHPSFFQDATELEDFKQRFRPLSGQVQDNECRSLKNGTTVCACQCFGRDDLRFYDAVVDGVLESEHSWISGEELCKCTFILFWLHGPSNKTLTASNIESICIVESMFKLDPVVASFLEMARKKIKLFLPRSILMPEGVSGLEVVPYCNKRPKVAQRLGYFERIGKKNLQAKRSVVKVCSSEASCHDRRMEERMEDKDLKGAKIMCMLLIANIDKELCPSTVTEFLRKHISVSARVFLFPSLSPEIYTRGAIMLDSKNEFQKLCDFLSNPKWIITSSTGRPWVVIEKLVGLRKIKASLGTLIHVSKSESRKGKSGASSKLKVVHSETQGFKKACKLRDLFLEFYKHQERLHKRLALEEGRISAARSSDEEQLA